MPKTVLLVGTLDTKSDEYGFVREILSKRGLNVMIMDVGILGIPGLKADIDRDHVATAGGAELSSLSDRRDRGAAVDAMAAGAKLLVRKLFDAGTIDGVMALGGTGGTSLAATAFSELPLGFPKLIVSTAASGNTEMYIGVSDLVLVPSVVDIAGLNRISTQVIANAAAALAGMVKHGGGIGRPLKPAIAASMFGVTTACVTAARAHLEAKGYEVVVFHMTGSGGRALESLAAQGVFSGVLDLTTTELADNLVGGVFSAGPNRLTAAGSQGVPQVISVGALDMVNFGPWDSVPSQFSARNLYRHNSSVTLMRTTPDECALLGAELARKARSAVGATTVVLPLKSVSAIDVEGQPFRDPEADLALFNAIRTGLNGSSVELIELDLDINDPRFAETTADILDAHVRAQTTTNNKRDGL